MHSLQAKILDPRLGSDFPLRNARHAEAQPRPGPARAMLKEDAASSARAEPC